MCLVAKHKTHFYPRPSPPLSPLGQGTRVPKVGVFDTCLICQAAPGPLPCTPHFWRLGGAAWTLACSHSAIAQAALGRGWRDPSAAQQVLSGSPGSLSLGFCCYKWTMSMLTSGSGKLQGDHICAGPEYLGEHPCPSSGLHLPLPMLDSAPAGSDSPQVPIVSPEGRAADCALTRLPEGLQGADPSSFPCPPDPSRLPKAGPESPLGP